MSDNDHQDLLREGETIEQWWERNGLNIEQAQANRKATYAKQRLEMMKVYDESNSKKKVIE